MRHCVLYLLCALCIGGCAQTGALGPAYRGRVFDDPAQRSALSEAPLPPKTDETPLEDLALETARELALARNHTVAAATAAVSAAEARIAEARAAFLPELSGSIGRTFNRESRTVSISGGGSFNLSPSEVTQGSAQLSLSLFAFGRDVAALEAAKSAVDTQVLDERSVRQKLLHDVTQAWYRIHEADAQGQVASDALVNAQKQLRDAENLVAAGRATKDAALTARVESLRREQELLVVNNARIHARRVLNVLLVRAPNAPVTLAEAPEFQLAVIDAPTIQSWAREHNPSILSFRTRRVTLEQQRESVERSFLPEFRGTLGAEYSDFTEATGHANNYQATLGVQWAPIQGGRRFGRLAEIHAQLVELRERELQALADLELRIDRLLLDLQETESLYRVAEQSIEAATENLRVINDRFGVGRATAQEVLEAQVTLSNSRFSWNQARFRQRVLIADLESIVGVETSTWLKNDP